MGKTKDLNASTARVINADHARVDALKEGAQEHTSGGRLRADEDHA